MVDHVRALRERRVDGVELPAVVEDFIHITNEVTDRLELVTENFRFQRCQIFKANDSRERSSGRLARLTHRIFDDLVVVRYVFHIDRLLKWPRHLMCLVETAFNSFSSKQTLVYQKLIDQS